MKKTVLAVTVFMFLSRSGALAHPPEEVRIAAAGQTVTVTVVHPVSNPATHYVQLIRVSQEGRDPVEKSLTAQDPQGVTVSIEMPGVRPDRPIKVEAFCSRYGSISRTLTPEG